MFCRNVFILWYYCIKDMIKVPENTPCIIKDVLCLNGDCDEEGWCKECGNRGEIC